MRPPTTSARCSRSAAIPRLSIKTDESYDPYAHRPASKSGNGTRTDLRKLSEHIKRMRELEERKRNGGNGGGD